MRRAIFAGLVAAPVMLAMSPPALAAKSAVYGGRIQNGEPIVVTADAKFQKLRTMVVATRVTCTDGDWTAFSEQLTAAKAPPGFEPPRGSLKMKKNAKGAFTGTFIGGGFNETTSIGVVVTVKGKLAKATASGTFDVIYSVMDSASGELITTCYSGVTKFVASRKPGQIYGGVTKQREPVVLRVDAAHRRMSDFLFSWLAPCQPQGFYHEELAGWRDLSLSKAGSFNIEDSFPVQGDNGSTVTMAYTTQGKIGKTSASGTLSGKYTEVDASGTQTDSCDSGPLRWNALTG